MGKIERMVCRMSHSAQALNLLPCIHGSGKHDFLKEI
jgi:hypothetical protein